MQYSKQGLALTESFEGCKLKAYQDVRGVWTIGYGHTANVVAGMTCTQAQAEQWLADDIAWASNYVNSHVTVTLTQNEHDALTDFVYNCGCQTFHDSTLLHLVNTGQLVQAAHQFEQYDKSKGQVVAGLLRRRIAEEQLFTRA